MEGNQAIMTITPDEAIKVADSITSSRDQAMTVLIFGVIALSGFIVWLMYRKEKDGQELRKILVDTTRINAQAILTLEKIADDHSELKAEMRTMKDIVAINKSHMETLLTLMRARS